MAKKDNKATAKAVATPEELEAKKQAEAKAKTDAEAKTKAEAEAKAKADAEAKAKSEKEGKIIFKSEDGSKHELLVKEFTFKGKKYVSKEAVKDNADVLEALVEANSFILKKV